MRQPKMRVLGGKIREGVVRYLPPTNSFLLFGVLTSVPILVKIDQEMRPWECPQTDTDRRNPIFILTLLMMIAAIWCSLCWA